MSSMLGDVRVTFLLFRWDRFPRSCFMIMIVELQNFLGCLGESRNPEVTGARAIGTDKSARERERAAIDEEEARSSSETLHP